MPEKLAKKRSIPELLNIRYSFRKTNSKWSDSNYWCFQSINQYNCSIFTKLKSW